MPVRTPPMSVRTPRPPFESASRITYRADAPHAPAASHMPAAAVGDPTQPPAVPAITLGRIRAPPAAGPPRPVPPTNGFAAPGNAFSPAVPPATLDQLLTGYDAVLRQYLVSGFSDGFSIDCSDLEPGDAGVNLPSCSGAPHIVDDYIAGELAADRLAGPFQSPCSAVTKISPIGLVSKKTPGTHRVIHHLSYPAGDSVNADIPRSHTAVQCGSLDDAVEILADIDAPFLAKTDNENAFRLILIHSQESNILGFRWRGRIYKDRALPMGCSSSSQNFQTFSDALVWMAHHHFGAGPIISVLDDFLFIESSRQACSDSLTGFQNMCQRLNVPLHPEKTVLPCRRLQFLGVELDVAARVMRLPPEKLDRARDSLTGLLTRRKAPLRQVQACLGMLSFACLAVPLGRPFLRRLSDLCIGVRRPHHRVSITRAARLDIQAWMLFLESFNGRSLLDQRRWLRSPGLLLETDAAGGVGIGAICGRRWLTGRWPTWLRGVDIGVQELVAVVVPIHIWAATLTNHCVMVRSENSSVVALSTPSPLGRPWQCGGCATYSCSPSATTFLSVPCTCSGCKTALLTPYLVASHRRSGHCGQTRTSSRRLGTGAPSPRFSSDNPDTGGSGSCHVTGIQQHVAPPACFPAPAAHGPAFPCHHSGGS